MQPQPADDTWTVEDPTDLERRAQESLRQALSALRSVQARLDVPAHRDGADVPRGMELAAAVEAARSAAQSINLIVALLLELLSREGEDPGSTGYADG